MQINRWKMHFAPESRNRTQSSIRLW